MTPKEASLKKNEAKVYWNLYGDLKPHQKPKFSVRFELPRKNQYLRRDILRVGQRRYL